MRSNRSLLNYALFAGVAACGGMSGGGGGGGGGGSATGAFNHYVVNSVTAPTSQSVDDIVHIDSMGNPVKTGGVGVNKLGGLFATLKIAGNIDIQTPLTEAVNDGSLTLLADLQTPSFTTAAGAGFQMFIGDDPCTGSGSGSGCGQYNGTTSFTIASMSGDPALEGPVSGGTFNGGPGDITIEFQLAAGAGSATPLTINLKDALVQASSISATGIGMMTLGGAILETDINGTLIPTVAMQLNETVAAECVNGSGAGGSDCGSGTTAVDCSGATPPKTLCCTGAAGSLVGANSAVGLDANKDCTITTQELMTNSVVSSLLGPDVASTGNSKPDAVSFGIAATCVGATYTVAGEGSD
jgi:hypothetical protein